MLWGLLAKSIVQELDDRGWDLKQLLPNANVPDGILVSEKIVMELLYSCCCERDNDGNPITISKMDTKQAGEFFERCRMFIAQEPWCVNVPDPTPFWRTEL
jgi:hypothetical protein